MYEPGTVLVGKYRIERQLGRGGMGVVLAAEHMELRTSVAVKCVHHAYAGRDDVVKRFLREARASARLTSDHVCRVFDVGKLDTGVPYFVMELLHGRDLAKVLRTNGPLDIATATAYILQACDALQEAHSAQIIHRDLKPSNLFLTQRRGGAPFIKVLDFGVAKAPEEGDFSLTGTETIVGSPAYMAPEQIRAAKIADERSDIWSLGVILYELVSGKQPFRSTSIGDLAIRVATEPIEPLRGAPLGFAMTVARCLEKDPARRFQTIGELVHTLATCVEPSQVPALVPVPLAAPGHTASLPQTLMTYPASVDPPVSTTLRSASGSVSPRWAPLGSRRTFVIAGVAAILIGVGFGILMGPLSRTGDDAAPHQRVRSEMPSPAARDSPAAPELPAPPVNTPALAPAPLVAMPAPAAPPVEPIDAGVSPMAKPVPAEGNRQRPATPPRRPSRPKSKDQIGESRI